MCAELPYSISIPLRAARQGDPGSTRYFLSLEDNLFRIFGGEKIRGLMSAFQVCTMQAHPARYDAGSAVRFK